MRVFEARATRLSIVSCFEIIGYKLLHLNDAIFFRGVGCCLAMQAGSGFING
jgi:hypothetical protein